MNNAGNGLSRRKFVESLGLAAAAAMTAPALRAAKAASPGAELRPRCITMWDFSWIERRWTGAGYADWELALDELVERGYDALRIDVFPHLIAADPDKEWELVPVWYVNEWGSPAPNRVRPLPALHEFLALCQERDVKVGISSWYREDVDNTRMKIDSAVTMADQWNTVLAGIEKQGLMDTVLYVDLCNEWPGDLWAPFFRNDPPTLTWGGWHTETSMRWMQEACQAVRREYPELPIGFSFEPKDPSKLAGKDLSFLDFADPHLWLAQANGNEFVRAAGIEYDRFSPEKYASIAKAGPTYRSDPEHWQNVLKQHILKTAAGFEPHGMPLVTTECWGVVDYKDWPLFDWAWLKEICRYGVETAAGTSQWLAIATSNFAGPQFVGMWSDVEWHQSANAFIKRSAIQPNLRKSLLATRL